jgi:hypothetical protein
MLHPMNSGILRAAWHGVRRTGATASRRLDRTRRQPLVEVLEDRQLLTGQAFPHSLNVAIIGGPTINNGGALPITGPAGELGDFYFTNLDPAQVSAATLAAYDTAVLNVSSDQMGNNTTGLSTQAKSDLVAFVGSGNKLIIYD